MDKTNTLEQQIAESNLLQKLNKNWLVPFLVIITLLSLSIAGYFRYMYHQGQQELKEITSQKTAPIPTTSPAQTQVDNITPIDSTWILYTNNKLGFSIKIPKLIAGELHNNCPDNYTVPIAVYSNDTSVYITSEYFYEYPQNNVCQKTMNSLNIIDQRTNQWKNGRGNSLFVPKNWHVIVKSVENDTELENFIKTNYGVGCKLGTKSLSPSGIYDIKIQGDNLDLSISKCPINFMYVLKYSPELHKAATWGVGQEITFSALDRQQTYDSEMINSFEFINYLKK